MSCCFSKSSPELQQQRARNKDIETKLRDAGKENQNTVKLLLLGTGDAGKSTFAKQLVYLHGNGFTPDESELFKNSLRSQCLDGMIRILHHCKEWDLALPKDMEKLAEEVDKAIELNEDVAKAIQTLWQTKAVQQAIERSNEMQLSGGASGMEYCVKESDRFAKPNFMPQKEDIFRAKIRTVGVFEFTFKVNGVPFKLVDVGGQRTERTKWLQAFDGVTAVIYLAALDEYDMVLDEDLATNRLEESLTLFRKLTEQSLFQKASCILFLNKSDLFRKKIKTKPLAETFEDYEEEAKKMEEGLDDFERSCEYIKKLYTTRFKGERLYPFFTCAIDTESCEKVFTAVRDSVLNEVMGDLGL